MSGSHTTLSQAPEREQLWEHETRLAVQGLRAADTKLSQPASQPGPVRPGPGGMPSSRGWAWETTQHQGFLESSEAQGWGNRLLWQGRFARPLSRPRLHPVSSWGCMELAPAGTGSLEAPRLPVGPHSSLESSVHQPAGPKVTPSSGGSWHGLNSMAGARPGINTQGTIHASQWPKMPHCPCSRHEGLRPDDVIWSSPHSPGPSRIPPPSHTITLNFPVSECVKGTDSS